MKNLKDQKKNRVLVRKDKGKISIRWIKMLVKKMLDYKGLEGIEISVYITDDQVIRELNKNYRGKDKATDVLSFVFDEPAGSYKLLGEIVISIDTAKKQSEAIGHSIEEEIKRLLVHGFVHLLGYDHELKEEEGLFREIEEDIMKALV